MDQARYATSDAENYLDTATINKIQSFVRPPYLMILYSLRKICLIVMNKWRYYLEIITFTTELVWDH